MLRRLGAAGLYREGQLDEPAMGEFTGINLAALSLVPLGGGLTFLLLMKAGLDGRATSGPDFGTEIIFSAAGLKTFVVYVQGRGLEGIGYSLWDNHERLDDGHAGCLRDAWHNFIFRWLPR